MAGQQNGSYRSVELAERALDLIKRHDLSADPSSYAVWYTYVGRTNSGLTQNIDGVLARKGKISDGDIHEIRQRYLSDLDSATKLSIVGEKLSDEVEQVVGMIEASIGVAGGVAQGLTDASHQLAVPIDRDTLRGIVEAVLLATNDMQQENANLGYRLKQSHEHISELQERLTTIRTQALTDPLTGLANRRHFDERLADELLRNEMMEHCRY